MEGKRLTRAALVAALTLVVALFAAACGEEIQRLRCRQEGYTSLGPHRRGEGMLDLLPRRVRVMHDSRYRMRALEG